MDAEEFKMLMAKANANTGRRRHVGHEEDDIQEALIKEWDNGCYLSDFGDIKVKLLHHSPNGGFRTESTGARFKRMGVRAGFPDLFLMVPNGKKHGLFIELKAKNGRQSKAQKEYEQLLELMGYEYVLLKAENKWEAIRAFRHIIKEYLYYNTKED